MFFSVMSMIMEEKDITTDAESLMLTFRRKKKTTLTLIGLSIHSL